MNIAGIDYESVNDGEGVRTVIYVSGCSHNCPKCHNPQTHDVNYGIPFTEELQNEIIENIKKRPFVSGLTLSGGDPLHENNLDEVLNLVNKIRLLMPEKTIWLYTGYELKCNPYIYDKQSFTCHPKKNDSVGLVNDYIRSEIIKQCNVVVDGRYIDAERDITLKWKGSKNQRCINIKETLKQGEIVLWCD